MANGPFFEYYASVVEILDKNGQTHGVGSIIDDSHVITCAHVVGMCLVGNPDAPSLGLSGRKIQVRRSYVNGRNSEPHEAEVELYFSREENSASADLALLRLSKEQFAIGGNCRLASFSDALVSRGEIVFATGFPDDAVGTRGGAAEAEYRAGGPQPNLWISLTDTRGFGEEIRPGFSGAPVWSESAKANVGLITEADNTRRTATLIPTTLIKSVAALPISGGQPLENRNHGDVNAFHRPSSRLGPFRTCMEFLIPSLHYFLTARLAFFHDPPERDIFARYLRNSAAELYERMKEKTYIPSIAAEPPETAPLLWRGGNFANPIQQLIRELAGQSAGGDSASAEISAISKRSHRVRRLIGTLMRSDDPLILLGEPGSGKSLTLQQAMMLLSYQNIRRVQPTICLYFSLGRLTPVSQPNIHTIESFVRSSSPQEIRPYLEFLENAGRLVLIFDGMDEMSRELYIDHTAALSAYAESRRGVIRTLFSCRIADFSPNFRHRRLLLLPFDIDHVYLYIRRQFGANAIDVDGQLIKPKALARLLLSDEITIQAGNPFILWLLCLYIHENHHIPQNRVALLKHYYNYMYSMKSKERGNADLLSRSVDEVFDMWGEIALEITNRNQGSEIPLQDVNLKLGPKATIALAAGRACGSLQQSFGDSTPKVRFEHHRAQEFFAARALLRASADFNWTDKLDIPRWQETLVNVALMGGGGEALQVLKASLENVPEILNSRDGTFEHFMSENLVAERVEVGARIAREMSAVEERNDLWSHLQRSVQRLLESGDPASKVKMLRLIQRNPSQFSTSDLTAVLNHPSVWVRDQANTVATRLSTQIARSPLPMELLYSFTTGTLPLRLRSFLKMAREVQRPAIYVVCLCGLFLMMAQACAFGTIDIVLAHAQESVFSDLLSVDTLIGRIVRARWYFPAFYAVVVVSVLVSAIKFAPRSWLIVPAVGLLIIGAPLGLQVLWTSDDLSLFGIAAGIFGLAVAMIPVIAILAMLGALIWISTTLLFGGVLAAWAGDRQLVHTCVRSGWETSDIPTLMREIGSLIGQLFLSTVLPGAGVLAFIAAIGFATEGLHDYWIDFKFTRSLGTYNNAANAIITCIVVLWFMLCITFLIGRGIVKSNAFGFKNFVKANAIFWAIPVGVAIYAAVTYAIGQVIEWVVSFTAGAWTGKIAVLVLLLGLIIALIFLLIISIRSARRWMEDLLRRLRHTRIDPQLWCDEIRMSPPHEQARLLVFARPENLGISYDRILRLLIDLQKAVKADPALSIYHAKIAEILELRRQERTG